jgi:UDP-N-acetylglucosamine diphosphorylase / glucose-1-phosphate thymidylyltransferase / UDP-N-acetylgalactosamine diphosphorylase / glucosamine-1-phosphate N-acetyltransferase / galactosamine-1-phosphate N-acetyltransferase
MKAIILAAGKGKRMGELTKECPKPMVPVQGKPILEHIVEGLRDHAGVKEFFIITGHCAEVIEDYFKQGQDHGVSITYGRQEVADGTGKAPELGREWVGASSFILSYGDILMQPDLYAGLVKAFVGDGVISVKRGENTSQGGAVILDQDFILERIVEKAAPGTVSSPWYNAGVYAFQSSLFTYTAQLEKSPRGEYELTDALSAMARDGLKISGYELKGDWADVRDPQVLNSLNQNQPAP